MVRSNLRPTALLALISSLVTCVPAVALTTGRAVDAERRARLTLNVGGGSPIEGGVQETERPLNDIRDEVTPEAPESFTFRELGLSESESTYGLSFEYQWTWATLLLHSSRLDANANGVAPRDLFLGVEDVSFGGRQYDYQRIPAGTAYQGRIDLVASQLRAAVTPLTVNAGGRVELIPWVSLGLFALAGDFEVDAGPAQGVQLYEFPAREYVVGGSSRGEAAAVAPEIGIGGEVHFRLTERAYLALQGTYAFADLSGSSSDLGVSSRNEKDIDLDYEALDARLAVELPLRGTRVLVGAEYRNVDIHALAEAKERTDADVVARQEKFNKNVAFQLETALVFVGVRW
jgi:hypothetical protein